MASSSTSFACPIIAGEEERWRRFVQELTVERWHEYNDLRFRLGITRQKVWLVRTSGGVTAFSCLECKEPRSVVAHLAASTEPFDMWLKDKLAEFHGCDFARLNQRWFPELVFEAGESERSTLMGEPSGGEGGG